MAELVRKTEADVGIAFDGDGDRLIMSDEKGAVIDGDFICAICAKDLKDEGRLQKDTVVGTLMSNMGLEVALKRLGAGLVRTKVGDRYIVEEMRAKGYNLGGEQSGHVVFLDLNTTGDGIMSALQVLAAMQRSGKPLSELSKIMEPFPQTLINVAVREKPALSTIPPIKNAVEEAETQLGDNGRILVRYSGTENLARVMVEANDQGLADSVARHLSDIIKNYLGVEA